MKRRTLDECLEALNESHADGYVDEIESSFDAAQSCETVADFDANLDAVIAAARMLINVCRASKSRPVTLKGEGES